MQKSATKNLGSLPEQTTSHVLQNASTSQIHRMKRVKKTSGGHLLKLPHSRPSCPNPFPDGFYILPRMKIPKPP